MVPIGCLRRSSGDKGMGRKPSSELELAPLHRSSAQAPPLALPSDTPALPACSGSAAGGLRWRQRAHASCGSAAIVCSTATGSALWRITASSQRASWAEVGNEP